MTQTNVSVKQIATCLRKIKIEGKSILLIKSGTRWLGDDALGMLNSAMRGKMGFESQIILAIVDDFDDLTTLNKQEMNKLGWYRLEDIRKLVGRPSLPPQENKVQ